ncbi:hypothetical protein EQV97_24185 [Pseudomonas sp. TMW22090]|uniref:hypothetical protein n=1 Tax=Pseudomonas sp. TMW22090 TaxID=2506434 RepID=UPI001F0FA7C2|nr:hypothetical protein [Pseudomonas sp. TMW22090]MCH4880456.1 hypothetical protein [Pseudomonas sp. TMW22090]
MQPLEYGIKSQAYRKNNIPPTLLTSLLFIFIIGFIPQLLGLLSLTTTNILILFILSIFIIRRQPLNGRAQSLTIYFFAVSSYMLISGIINGTSLTSILVYIYYLLATYIAIKSAELSITKGYITQYKIVKILPTFLFAQVLVCTLQNIFSTQISQFSKTPIIPLDIASGTFHLASDASLGFFCLISIIFAFATDQSKKLKYLVLLLASAVVLLTNSKASHLMLIIILTSLISFEISSKIRSHKTIITAVAPIILVAIALFSFENFYWAQDLVHGTLIEAYDKRFAGTEAHRLAPIGEMLYGQYPFFGHGLLSYYNPIEKVWLYNSGSSLFYTIFIDCGLLATLLIYSFFLYIVIRGEIGLFFGSLYFFAFFSYSFFNFGLTDIAAIFTFSAYLNIHRKKLRNKNA